MPLILFLILGLVFRAGHCGSTFRFGAVISTVGRARATFDAKNGYELYFDAVNALNDGRGFYVQGQPNTTGFYFNYEFLWREDFSSRQEHKRQLSELLTEKRIHFLGGSHHRYASIDMHEANKTNVLCYHCCVAPDTIYEADYRTSFGIPASNADFTRTLIRRLHFEDVRSFGIIYEDDDASTRTICQAAETFVDRLGIAVAASDKYVIRFNSSDDNTPEIAEFARQVKKLGVEAVIACVEPYNGQALVHAFDEDEYSLKAFFLTIGPTEQWWVNSFDNAELVSDLLSSTQWHHNMNYKDEFFGSTRNYVEQYRERFMGLWPDQHAAGASAVGLTLTQAIQNAFMPCNITKTEGDVDALLNDVEMIDCYDDLGLSGYDRVLRSLSVLESETLYGKVKFNHLRRNIALTPVTTQVFSRKESSEIAPVLPFGYATELFNFPAKNRFRETCGPGYHASLDPFGSCELCEAGTASGYLNAYHGDSCPVGHWTNMTGQSACMPCPSGTSTNIVGATGITDCVCMPGFFNLARETGVECDPCPEGAVCKGGTNGLTPEKGYWQDVSRRSEVYECDSDAACLGGANSTCAEGYAGRLCAVCADGYFGVAQACRKCFGRTVIILQLVLLLLGWYVLNVIVSSSVASLEMILSWAQLANIIGDIDLRWTSMLAGMFSTANILDFDVDILEPTCLLPWSFRHNLIVQLTLPFVMSLMAACGYLLSALVLTALEGKWLTLKGTGREVLSFFVKVTTDRRELRKKWDATVATFLASVDTTHLTIAKYCFDCFRCRNIAGVSVLRAAPEVECGSGEHTQLVLLASLGIVFYIIGYLFFISWKLYDLQERRAFAEEDNILRFGFIYQKYELDYYYTPALSIVRKLLFVCVLVFVNNPAFQIGSLAILIITSIVIHTYTAPYIDTHLDVLFNFLLLSLMFEAFGGLMFYSENLPAENRIILEWIVMATLVILICVFFVFFCMEVKTKFHIHEIKKWHRDFARKLCGKSSGRISDMMHRTRKKVPSTQTRDMPSMSTASSDRDTDEISFELLHTFHPSFVYQVMKTRPDFIQDWDKLTTMLEDFMSDQAEISYLSMNPSAKFWRKLVNRFPELIDFLAVSSKETRDHFNAFATELYCHFYLSKKVSPLPLMDILNWRDHAPMAQWLAIAPEEDRIFFLDFVSEMFRIAGKEEDAAMLESMLHSCGQDPHLISRCAKKKVSKKQKLILNSISQGSNPFQHSAARIGLVSVPSSTIGSLRMSKAATLGSLDSAAESSFPEVRDAQERPPGDALELSTEVSSMEDARHEEIGCCRDESMSSSSSQEKKLNNGRGNETNKVRGQAPFTVSVDEIEIATD